MERDALPRIHVRCSGVRSSEGDASRPGNDCVFFSESQYHQSPFLVRVAFNSVSFVHRGTHVVERRFVFPGRVLDAVLADFSTQAPRGSKMQERRFIGSTRLRRSPLPLQPHPHVCVLVRFDCLNVYTAAGEVFEVALPFQANRIFPMEGRGLLLQRSPAVQVPVTSLQRSRDAAAVALTRKNRRASTSNRGDGNRCKYSVSGTGAPVRPRYFTLRHPLDEVRPVAQSLGKRTMVGKGETEFISDSAFEAVDVLEEEVSPMLVAFHCVEQRFHVFRMNVVETNVKRCCLPHVKIVDIPTWTRYRAKSDLDELRVRIKPEWIAELMWKSPRVGPVRSNTRFEMPLAPPMLATASPVSPSPMPTSTSSISRRSSTKLAFIASGCDGFPLLCIMDKDSGTLFLKPLSEQGSLHTKDDRVTGDVRTLYCRDAVPISHKNDPGSREGGKDPGRQRHERSTDIVVLETSGTLTLYRAHRSICRLILPDLAQEDIVFDDLHNDGSKRMRLTGIVQLLSIDKGRAYEIVFPYMCGGLRGKIWRYSHPLKIVDSPLLQQVFDVLDCIVPPPTLSAFRAQVVCKAQLKAQSSLAGSDVADGGLEWQSFRQCVVDLLPRQACTRDTVLSPITAGSACGDEEKTTATSFSSAFHALCQSKFHDMYQYEHAMLFATMELPVTSSLTSDVRTSTSDSTKVACNRECSRMRDFMEAVYAGLHLLCEELKLSIALFRQRLYLVDLLSDMGLQLGLIHFVAYYQEDNCILTKCQASSTASESHHELHTESLLRFTTYGRVPDLIMWLQDKMTANVQNVVEFPALFDDLEQQQLPNHCSFRRPRNPLWRTRAICRAYELMFPKLRETAPQPPAAHSNALDPIIYLAQDPVGSALSLEDLPVGLSFPIVQSIRRVKHNPPPFITEDVCAFVGREDLSIASAEDLTDRSDPPAFGQNQQQHGPGSNLPDSNVLSDDGTRDDCDGLEGVIRRSQPLFPADQRMKEVARLLRSCRPLCLKLDKTPDLSDQDYAQQQQSRLLLLCKRSMALPVARGMVTLGSVDVPTAQSHTWRLRIPALPLTGRKPPANAIVELDLSGYATELTYWPQFHNGCATGLRLPAHDLSGAISRHWIKYHRPSVSEPPQQNSFVDRQTAAAVAESDDTAARNMEEAYAAHGGLLMGIGLRGHLKCLSMADVYNYLSLSNEFVTVGIMLGMASTAAHCRSKRKQRAVATGSPVHDDESQSLSPANEDAGVPSLEVDTFFSGVPELGLSETSPLFGTGSELALERSVSKMLCLHVPSLLPLPSGGFSVPASTQTAALLGLGILYQGTGYRLMTELLLTEIARSPSSSQCVGGDGNAELSTALFDQLEGYALAAGMALGLVILGRGQTTTGDPGLADLKLEEKLHKYIVGGAQQLRDPNAAGSCLYRGRRWQAFGTGNGVAPAVNGSTSSSNGTLNASSETFSGAGHGSKQSNGRSGTCGMSEHVNVGVTGCASALALAFMYIQTDNRAVAAQLVVPDTLILLDYVRPDILLVRTLAKNLVMWSNILPTIAWIDQHEVPAQLLQAYKSIETPEGDFSRPELPSGVPSRSDLGSICEAYANIVTGACLSIGLRFAGTGNTSARATLRKYVLHFRELRAKASMSSSSMLPRGSSDAVAAATERATVERCLAVCAQALALIDAGTGHVETLTLLRSLTLRQRVDAAVSYGNHMGLAMAIGLLFLGGGRATVSRSKEAIAALVISLYPIPPMNTADNKYHLQAFRHLYVRAVDTSRFIETLDVNTKTTSAVQVRVELLPNSVDKSQSLYRELRSPCLLPDITAMKRLVISDPEFYPIEIVVSPLSDERRHLGAKAVKTANALRLDLLQNKNVVFLKRRQQKDNGHSAGFAEGSRLLCDVHIEDHNGGDDRLGELFRLYFATSIAGDEDDCAVSEDDVDGFNVADWGSSWWSSQLSLRSLEKVSDEVPLLMPSYVNALHALFRLQQVPQLSCATDVVNLSMFSEYCRLEEAVQAKHGEDDSENVRASGSMVNSFSEFGAWLSHQTEEALGALWHRTSLNITSMASARVQLLSEASPSTPPTMRDQMVMDAFFVSVLVRYFGGVSVSSLPVADQPRRSVKDWKGRFERVLSACSRVDRLPTGMTSPARFQLPAFLQQEELSSAEKTFWLKLVSFFLFSD
ncbi:unnamed protein product [Hyaloperonospora brassicae]|uniref:Anaphase-promoting complex subunit 1 N-terminal domain-containing protein n=1 Tax=Hyaloperonospora brassicae TaxID=162125 RepID=A0AAV0TGJ1_HYABA|nr:unnamed protein product [Hyaloperonospora brassicae]